MADKEKISGFAVKIQPTPGTFNSPGATDMIPIEAPDDGYDPSTAEDPTLTGARWTRPGLLVTGEAAGSTYSFTGEGIGKAMETGMLAADAIMGHADDAAARTAYEAGLTALKPKFELYERANRVNAHPWLADLLIWRAKKSPRLLKRMSGVLNETSNPGNLVSLKGISRLFFE